MRMNLGPLRLSQTYKTNANGVLEADFRLEVPKRRISASEYEVVRVHYKNIAVNFRSELASCRRRRSF